MEPIRGVLDERFFEVASPECLQALARLVDDALAKRLQMYLDSVDGNSRAASAINEYLGSAIKACTFHLKLLERGSVDVVNKIELETIADASFDQHAIIEELEFLKENIQYIRSYIEPRKKGDYADFVSELPPGYRGCVLANKVMFYQPRARARATGVGAIIRKRDVWLVALKGLKFREYYASKGYAIDGYMLKEF